MWLVAVDSATFHFRLAACQKRHCLRVGQTKEFTGRDDSNDGRAAGNSCSVESHRYWAHFSYRIYSAACYRSQRERESLKWDSRRELVQGFSITTSIETREMQPSWGAWSRIRCKEAHRTDEIAWERISVHADLQHAVIHMPDQ